MIDEDRERRRQATRDRADAFVDSMATVATVVGTIMIVLGAAGFLVGLLISLWAQAVIQVGDPHWVVVWVVVSLTVAAGGLIVCGLGRLLDG